MCCLTSGKKALHFKFGDVEALVIEEGGERLTGTFVSGRDRGTYAAQRKTSGVSDDLRQVHYQGKWFNREGKSGEFSIQWLRPDSVPGDQQIPAAAPSSGLASAVVSYGTQQEPVFLVPDRGLFNDNGRTIMNMFLAAVRKQGVRRPDPTGDVRWRSWKRHPEGCGDRVRVRALEPMADRILADCLRVHFADTRHVMTRDRGYQSKDCNVYAQGGSAGRHQDAQPYGSLVFVFCAGLSCHSTVWLKDGTCRHLDVRSGDCMIFEGKTWHAVSDCIPDTSPFAAGEWLAHRRLSILVRQRPPGK